MESQAEKVLGMMEKMKLSESEKKSIKIRGSGGGSLGRRGDPQAVGKVLTEKPVRADALEATLGRVWCPLRGVECKDLGGNRFLFTFLQGSGKRKALEDGPWMFGKDLIIMAEFDATKRVDEIVFSSIPIWVRVSKLPLGLMNKEAGEEIGEMIGEVIKVEADENGLAYGECLRIKIRLNICKPLMRGVILDLGEDDEEEKKVWCPLSYEYLLDFCYTCGMIGHTDRSCEIKLKKGEEQQFSRSLQFILEKKKAVEDAGSRSSGQHSQLPWRVNRGGRGGSDLFGKRGSGSAKGSDELSWRKSGSEEKLLKAASRSESKASSPLKTPSELVLAGQSKKLDFGTDTEVAGSGEKREVEGKGEKSEEGGG